MATLRRTDTGYVTPDGRWTVVPVMVDDSPRNKGRRAWRLTDTTGQANLGHGRTARTYDALYIVREVIEDVTARQEQS